MKAPVRNISIRTSLTISCKCTLSTPLEYQGFFDILSGFRNGTLMCEAG